MSNPGSSSNSYFLHRGEEQEGPLSAQEIEQMYAAGEVDDDTLVWREGVSDWMSIDSVITDLHLTRAMNAESMESHTVKGVLFELACTSCGGKLDYTSGSDVACCPFCGSLHLVRTESNEFNKLNDLGSANLRIYHDLPKISGKDAIAIIHKAIRSEKAGFKDPEKLQMEVNSIYVPAWCVKTRVECSWHGEYSEKRTVTKWRKVSKTSGTRRYEVDEPYSDTEIIWHPRSGSHTFETRIWAPATPGFSLDQLHATTSGLTGAGSVRGEPPLSKQIGIASATKSQVQAWEEFNCDNRIEKISQKECQKCIERLHNVRAVCTSKDFSLTYLPIAVVSYEANNCSFRHFLNLKTGHFSGDLPLDEKEVQRECVTAAKKQFLFNIAEWIAATAVCVEIGIVSALIYNGALKIIQPQWYIWLGVFIAGISVWFTDYNPWKNFRWSRRAFLLRILGSPPSHLASQMHVGLNADRMRRIMEERAWNNSMEGGNPEKVHILAEHSARVLLKAASPLLAVSISSRIKAAATMIVASLASYTALNTEVPKSNVPATVSSSLSLSPVKNGGVSSKISKPEIERKGSSPVDVEKNGQLIEDIKMSASRPDKTVEKEQATITASVSTVMDNKARSQQNESKDRGEVMDPTTTIKLKLADLKGELASVESRIEAERKKWQDANAAINALTINRTQPVVRNSPEHVRMYEAQLIMKEVEAKAPELKEDKARIEATINALEGQLN